MSVSITFKLSFEDGTEITDSATAIATPTQEPPVAAGEKIPPYGVPAQSSPRLVASPSFVRVA